MKFACYRRRRRRRRCGRVVRGDGDGGGGGGGGDGDGVIVVSIDVPMKLWDDHQYSSNICINICIYSSYYMLLHIHNQGCFMS